MEESSSTAPSLSDASPVLEISGKIVIAGVLVIFIVITFILILHLYARCLWPRNADGSNNSTIMTWRQQLAAGQQPGGGRRRRPRGLDKSTLDSLPVVAYDPKECKEGLECAVCLCELQQGEKTRLLPRCKHMFHADCVDVWFQSHSTCPICRDHLVVVAVVVSDSDSDTTSDDDSSEDENDDAGNSAELQGRFPTNVLFWGDETQVRSLELPSDEEVHHAQQQQPAVAVDSTFPIRIAGGENSNGMLVIDIPCESCSSPSIPEEDVVAADQEDGSSPMATRLRSLKRLLSGGKRVAPSPSSFPCTSNSLGSSGDPHQHV